MTQPKPNPVDVAVGVLIRPDGQVLLAQRPEGKPYAGWWEFPGGKLEAGESVEAALARELEEELGLSIGPAHPWVTLGYVYPHATVRLHFCRCFDWRGDPIGREGQAFTWADPAQSVVAPLLPATVPAMKWLQLPDEYAISQAAGLGAERFLERLALRLENGLRAVQLREPHLGEEDFDRLFERSLALVRARGARLLVNSGHPERYWHRADGVQLRALDWKAAAQRPDLPWVGASCHTRQDIADAAALGVDFAVLGPVLATPTHPDESTLGWTGFAEAATGNSLPVYAIGGLSMADLPAARGHRAHGVAALRAPWA
jgi:8-oxo-dGTP diphosphatase